MREEIKQLLKEANSMSQPSTFAQAAKLRRMAAAKEKELAKYLEIQEKDMKMSIGSYEKHLMLSKVVTYCVLILWFWLIPVATISKELVQPFGRLLSWRGGSSLKDTVVVDNCFDIFIAKLCDTIFTYYKSWAASELLDPSFLFALDIGEKFSVQPMRFTALLKTTRVKARKFNCFSLQSLLGRTINLRNWISEKLNKICRENIEFLFDRFESQDICAIVELEKLLEVLQLAHELLSKDLTLDSFTLMLSEMQENVSLVSYSSRLATQIWTEMQNDFLNLITRMNKKET